MKHGLIAAGALLALAACSQDQQAPPTSATATGWESSTQAGSSVPETQTAPSPTLATQAPTEGKRISVDELRTRLADGSAVVIDVRDAQSYQFQHAEGALSIPLAEVAARARELPKDKLIVAYCT